MVKKYKISDLQKVVTKEKEPPPCDDTMQITVQHNVDGIAEGVWEVDEKFINGMGIAMGGFLSSAADIMMAYAISSKLTDEQEFASIDLHTTFHRPTMVGEVRVVAKVEKMGRKLAYLVADLEQNGKKVASCVSSVLIIAK
ncbi:PaaI family thioesterase [Ornithinibacillus halophilus]|uniref:Uncharacterized domain 1-containing protein n=1 Tax=Ornithinibacillus halophilus TaxID=930117 RepID=A0A1M5GAZ5_9BACI|nr:PaaI family thioesterase [Ornithinibacillus halophilus]SHG00935.1 uncharacterized domain 1-containing protein [Ornithinibacillus halophilus]